MNPLRLENMHNFLVCANIHVYYEKMINVKIIEMANQILSTIRRF